MPKTKDGGLAVIISQELKKKKGIVEDEGSDEMDSEAKSDVIDELFQAIKDEDKEAFSEALESFIALC